MISLKDFEESRNTVNEKFPNEQTLGLLRSGDKLPAPDYWNNWGDTLDEYFFTNEKASSYEAAINKIFKSTWLHWMMDIISMPANEISLLKWDLPFDALCQNVLVLFAQAETMESESLSQFYKYVEQISSASFGGAYEGFVKPLLESVLRVAQVSTCVRKITMPDVIKENIVIAAIM